MTNPFACGGVIRTGLLKSSACNGLARALLGTAFGLSALGCSGPAVLTVDDVIVTVDDRPRIVGYVEREPFLGVRRDQSGVSMKMVCGARTHETPPTNEDGTAWVESDPATEATVPISATCQVDGRKLQAESTLFLWNPDRTIVVVDVDNTISQGDDEPLRLLVRQDERRPIPSAAETLREIAEHHPILYLTARPRVVLEKTRQWLAQHDFPAGPVFVAPGVRKMFQQEHFKTELLAELRTRWPNVLIGIGNRRTDAEAYGANGMLTLMVNPSPEDEFGAHSVFVKDWVSVRRLFSANHALVTESDRLSKALQGKDALLNLPLIQYQGPHGELATREATSP